MPTLKEFTVDGLNLVGEAFVETGYYRGHTLAHAAAQPFRLLFSVEWVQDYAAAGQETYQDDPRVAVVHGSSPAVLPGLCRRLAAYTVTFWLDAHYMGGDSCERDPAHGECPVLGEVAAIRSARWGRDPVIIVDDAPLFHGSWDRRLKAAFDPAQWPAADEVLDLLPGYDLRERNDVLYFLPANWNGW